jgi:hypothetical protein
VYTLGRSERARHEHERLGPFLLGRIFVDARFRNIWRCADGYVSFAIQGKERLVQLGY